MRNPVLDELVNVRNAGLLNPIDALSNDALQICRKRGFIVADDKGCYSLTFEGTRILLEHEDKAPPPGKLATPGTVATLARRMMDELKKLHELKVMDSTDCGSLAAMHACAARGWAEKDSKGRYILTKEGKQVLKDSGV